MDGRMLLVELVQIGQQELTGDGVAGADGQLPHLQLPGLAQLLLACFQQSHGAAHIFIQHLPLGGQGHAPAVPGEQTRLKIALQLLDGLAHGGLGDIQRLRCGGDVAHLRHLLEHTVQLQLNGHNMRLLLAPAICAPVNIWCDYIRKSGECKGKIRIPVAFSLAYAAAVW